MKVTKRQIKRIIKEEKARLLQEQSMRPSGDAKAPPPGAPSFVRSRFDWVETLGQMIDQDMTERNVDLRDEGKALMEALEVLRREYKDEMRGDMR